jgi:hypothetical protein
MGCFSVETNALSDFAVLRGWMCSHDARDALMISFAGCLQVFECIEADNIRPIAGEISKSEIGDWVSFCWGLRIES